MQVRFISQFRAYTHTIRAPYEEIRNGRNIVIEKGLDADFKPLDLTEREREVGLAHFRFRGAPVVPGPGNSPGSDPFDMSYRLSSFDSIEAQKRLGWTDEERELVEKTLMESSEYGLDFILVEDAKLPTPWPSYEKDTTKKILETVKTLGHDPEDIVAYERQNQNRAELIAALQEEGVEDDAVLVKA